MRSLGDEVALADWYLCEPCGDLADSIAELGFCYNLGGESLKQQIAEYRETEAAEREWQKTHNVQIEGLADTSPSDGEEA